DLPQHGGRREAAAEGAGGGPSRERLAERAAGGGHARSAGAPAHAAVVHAALGALKPRRAPQEPWKAGSATGGAASSSASSSRRTGAERSSNPPMERPLMKICGTVRCPLACSSQRLRAWSPLTSTSSNRSSSWRRRRAAIV